VSLVERENISPYWLQFVKERISVGNPITDIKAFLKLPIVKENNHHVFRKKTLREVCVPSMRPRHIQILPRSLSTKKKVTENRL